jgi:hypothetical protein
MDDPLDEAPLLGGELEIKPYSALMASVASRA